MSQKTDIDPIKYLQLRIPESLLFWLRERSQDEDRSINAQVKHILKKAQGEHKTNTPPR